MQKPDFEAFAKDLLSEWPEGHDIDAGDLQEIAIKHGLLYKVDGGYDPEKHTDIHCCAEPGDTWYMQSF
jgi:hypothetical protein